MKIALAQINTTIGDFPGNTAKIIQVYQRGEDEGVDLVICPELAISGYPPRDLLLKPEFIRENLRALDTLAAATRKTGLIVGFVSPNSIRPGREASNSVALLEQGRTAAVRHKTLLPTYDVFDEDRYFEPATDNLPVVFRGTKLGLTICEDVWNDEDFWRDRRYRPNPASALVQSGAQVLINISASPWHLGKNRTRFAMLSSLAKKSSCPLVYCNLVGGNDELIFDGDSLVFDAQGQLICQGRKFDEDFSVVDFQTAAPILPRASANEEKLYQALVLGLRDYLHKCGFQSAIVGLSGGIDSALVACLAAAALGPSNVLGISMPSEFSSPGSLDDARMLAQKLGIRYKVVPIQPSFVTLKHELQPAFDGRPEDVTEENIQARLRGVILMALSNKFGALVLTTGNKSEMAVGYCTLYGDMCGGLAVISDLPKTMVYRLAHWINREQEIIPRSSLTKPPSAELRPNQTDQDSLPPYEVLDAILEASIVQLKSPAQIVADGFDEATVKKVIRLINSSEYKRRQAAPGLKVTSKAFGVGRRIPLAQRFQEG
jgi:NAD+ synthase/NAD+ synthase (glutamine-hydrolysing)